ncbi:MAG: HD domain-containing protein [Oscillospiraceae bacterium]|nr:HD domain-containing protein [Oscillospiraceae bacterium]
MNFTQLENSDRFEGFALITEIEQKVSAKGEAYLDMTLSDSDGTINAKLWRYQPEVYGEYGLNDLVKIRGTISEYKGNDQLKIERIRPTLPEDNVKKEDFVKSAEYSREEMFNLLMSKVESFNDTDLKALVLTIYSDYRDNLLLWPAAFKLHHAISGGLLMHTLSIVQLAEGVCKIYPFIDRDLLLSGAMLHDIAKLSEFEVTELGTAEGYSVAGNLLGHIAMGTLLIDEYAKKLGISKKTAMLIEHMILSHHGEPEFGAAVRPMFIEAEILSELDLMDSRIYEMKEAVEGLKSDEFSQRVWALDNRKLYNHSRTDLTKKPEIL